MAAIAYHRIVSLETLVVFGAEIDPALGLFGETPLMLAVQYGAVDAVRLLLSLNVNTSTTSAFNETASQFAENEDEVEAVEIARLLLEHEKKSVNMMNRNILLERK